MTTFVNDLTTRQWDLYDYLKKQEDYKHLRDIMVETGLYGDDYDNHSSSGSRALRKDIRALKRSGIIQTTILSTSKGIKLATREEYAAYSKRKWDAIGRVINLQKLQDKKAGLNNQTRIVFGHEKPVVEAFVEEVQ